MRSGKTCSPSIRMTMRSRISPRRPQLSESVRAVIWDVAGRCFVLALHALQRHHRLGPQRCFEGEDRLTEDRVALLGHRARADGAGRDWLLDLAVLFFHAVVDLDGDCARSRSRSSRGCRCTRRRSREWCATAPASRSCPGGGRRRPAASAPCSPNDAKVPAAPPSIATKTRGSHCCSRSTWRQNSSIQAATLTPKVAGTACWPWVRPAIGISAPRSARSARAASASPISWKNTPMRLSQHQQIAGRDVLRGGAPIHPTAMRSTRQRGQAP